MILCEIGMAQTAAIGEGNDPLHFIDQNVASLRNEVVKP